MEWIQVEVKSLGRRDLGNSPEVLEHQDGSGGFEHHVGDQFLAPPGVVPRELELLGPAEVELDIVLLADADPAVDFDGQDADLAGGIAGSGLGHVNATEMLNSMLNFASSAVFGWLMARVSATV